MSARGRSTVAAVAALAALSLMLLPGGRAAAAKQGAPPKLDADAWILVDARDGTRLAGRAAARTLPIASATKLMTAYLALRELDLDQVLEAPAYAGIPAESVLGLNAGERIAVRDLLVALMLASANDAAVALAEGVSGSVPRFVVRMNGAARKLGLDATSYANPIGLDDPENGSSARDLATLARQLLDDERFARIVAKPRATLKSGAQPRTVETRNTLLLSDPTVTGIKTGHTQGAGYVLVASAERKGVPLVSVVLGAPSEAARDAESARLLDYGFSLYERRRAVRRDEPLGTVPVSGEPPLELLAAAGERITARADQKVGIELRAPDEVEGPIEPGERLGRAIVRLDGERVGAVPTVAARAIAAPSAVDEISSVLAVILIAGGSMLVLAAVAVAIRRRRAAPAGIGAERTPEQRSISQERRMERRRREGERT